MNSQQAVQSQAQNMIDRGCNYLTIDWYGPDSTFQNQVVQNWTTYLDSLCQNNVCPLQLALMEDAGTATRNASCNGQYICAFEDDVQYAYSQFMNSHTSYWKITVGSCSNRPVMLAYGWGAGSKANFGPTQWQQIRSWLQSNVANCNQQPLIALDGKAGLSSSSNLDGAYNWVGVESYQNSLPGNPNGSPPSGQFDTHFETGVSYSIHDWYQLASSSSQPVIIGSAYAGFNDTNADWGFSSSLYGEGRKMSRECGLVWVNSWAQLTTQYFSGTKQIQAVGIPTWNDYEEGTAIEPGIDNCLDQVSASASTSQNLITWTLQFGSTSYAHIYGNTSTIHHYALWELDGSTWTELSDHNNGMPGVSCSGSAPDYSCSAPLTPYTWSAGNHPLYVQAVGMPSIANHVSAGTTYSPEPVGSLSSSSINFPNTAVGTSNSQGDTVTNTGNATLVIPQGDAQITSGNGTFSISPSPYPGCTATVGRGCAVTVSFTPQTCQNYTGTLSITDNATNSPQTVSLSGTGTPNNGSCGNPPPNPSTITPNSYSFGNVNVGSQSPPENFVFTNNTGSTITPAISVPSGYVVGNTSGCSNLGNGNSCNVPVSCAPPGAGSYSGYVSAANNGTTIASAQVSCSGFSNTPQGTLIYSAVQNITGWTTCGDASARCGGGSGPTNPNWTPDLSSPSEPNSLSPGQTEDSAEYSMTESTGYSNGKFEIMLPGQDSVSQFELDVDVNLPNSSTSQAISFELGQAINGTHYPFQFQCDFKDSKLWRVYNPPTDGWVSTGVGCSPGQFPANTWVHLTFTMNTNNNQLNYTSFSVGGTLYPLNLQGFSPTADSPDSISVVIVFDGDKNADAYSMYADNMNIYNTAAPSPNATLSPSTLDLGTVTNGTATATRGLTLTNTGTGALSISSVAVSNPQFVIGSNDCGSSLAPNSSCVIGLYFAPTSGVYGNQTAMVTVSGGETVTATVTGANVNPGNILYSNLQNDPNWQVCATKACAGGTGGSGSFSPNQASPTVDQTDSGLYSITNAGYSAVQFKDHLAAQDSYAQFQFDADVYVANPGLPQNLIFGVAQALSNNYYAFQVMCDLKGGGIWRIWDEYNGLWIATSATCSNLNLMAGDWTHVSFQAQRTSGNQMQYLSVTIGSNTYSINSAAYNPGAIGADAIDAFFYEGGDGNTDSYSVYLDNVTISHK